LLLIISCTIFFQLRISLKVFEVMKLIALLEDVSTQINNGQYIRNQQSPSKKVSMKYIDSRTSSSGEAFGTIDIFIYSTLFESRVAGISGSRLSKQLHRLPNIRAHIITDVGLDETSPN
jgi:hypothetical protein